MHFYRKTFTTLLTAIFTLGGVKPGFAAVQTKCNNNFYIAKCDFIIPTYQLNDASTIIVVDKTYPDIALEPKDIFGLVAIYTYHLSKFNPATTNNPYGYLCWDFDDDKKNYDNLRKLFNSRDDDGPIECYVLNTNDVNNLLYMAQTNTPPTALRVAIPREPTGESFGYKSFGNGLKKACQANSVTNTKCEKCPYGLSAGAKYDTDTNTWTVFSTLADCYTGIDKYNTVTDITGEFYYDNTSTDPTKNACYYSGD